MSLLETENRSIERMTERPRRSARKLFATVPIAIASSLAITLNLVTPAQAAGQRDDSEGAKDKAPEDSGTISIALGKAASPAPSAARTAIAAIPASYTVRSGDTVSVIAGRFGLSTASVLAMNGLSWKSLIFPGQVLALTGPSGSAATPAPVAPAPAPVASATKYKVVSGDTISGIAGKFGVSTTSVLSANGLGSSSLIFPGQLVTIPGLATAASTHVSAPVAAPIPAPPAPAPAPAAPAPSGPTPVALTAEMRANASLIVQIGRQEGVDDRGIVIALAAAAQESGLRNVRYGDRDSLGLFQQRPSTGWGTPEQVLDAAYATRAFFGGQNNPNKGRTRGLLDIPGWQSMTVTQAAQAVQISAYPDAYAKWETSARIWLSQVG